MSHSPQPEPRPPDGSGAAPPRPALTGAAGVFLQDSDAHRYIDALSGLVGATAGFGQAPLIAAASAQMRRLPYALDPMQADSNPARRLAAELARVAPGDLNHVFLTSDTAAAIDLAVRAVIYMGNAQGRGPRKHFIALERSFHGSVGAAAGLTGIDLFHAGFDLPGPRQHHIPSPYPYRHPNGPDPEAVLAATVQAFHDKVQEIGGEDVAGFVCEPVQCGGGVIVPPPGYLRAMREACDDYGMVMILDEAATGLGRTGMMFACEAKGVVPDVLTLGSGLTLGYLPMGAMILSDRMYQVVAQAASGGIPFQAAAHPVPAAVALAALDRVQGPLLGTSRDSGAHFQTALRAFADHALVGDLRGRGLLAAIELVRDKQSKARLRLDPATAARLAAIGMGNGVVFRIFADGILGLAPPICITRSEIDLLIDRIAKTLDQFHAELKGS